MALGEGLAAWIRYLLYNRFVKFLVKGKKFILKAKHMIKLIGMACGMSFDCMG